MPDTQPTRRTFLATSAAVAAGGALLRDRALAAPDSSAADRVILGVMGVAGRGTTLATTFAELPNVEVKYVCDVDEKFAAMCASRVSEVTQKHPETVGDYRRILDDKDVTALVIATPDHWHAPAAIAACGAGKHAYVEKPCCHNPREGELLVEAAQKHNRLVQHGTQRRSWTKVAEAIAKVRAGEIGKVRFVRGWYVAGRGETGKRTPAQAPAWLNWDLWQGPAPRRPYTENVVHYKWHWFWHWGTGELGNNGIHSLDLCRWGMNVDYPVRVTSGGGRYYFDDDQETPDTQNVTFDFGDDRGVIVWEGRSCQPGNIDGADFGATFYGDKGRVVIAGGNEYKVFDPNNKELSSASGSAPEALHAQNFIDAIRGKEKLVAPIDEGVKSTLLCHLGSIAHRTGRTVNLDPQTHQLAGDDKDQAALWSREYEKGWEPKV